MVVARQMGSLGLLPQSLAFLMAVLYIMVDFSMFSLINFNAVGAQKPSSLHTIVLKAKHILKATAKSLESVFSAFSVTLTSLR